MATMWIVCWPEGSCRRTLVLVPRSWYGAPSTLTWYSEIPATLVAFQEAVTRDAFTVPLGERPVKTGVMDSMSTGVLWFAERRPATSVAAYSTVCIPSARLNGPEYSCQAPASLRYDTEATPLASSVASRETWTVETYHPFRPGVPDRLAVTVGGLMSTLNDAVCVDSCDPAPSVA